MIRALLLAFSLLGSATAATAESKRLEYQGVNLSGAEFNGEKLPAKFGQDYIYPNDKEIDYFVDAGMNVFRLPFRWERLQPQLGGGLDEGEARRIDAFVGHAADRGAAVILDPHNYARYRGKVIGSPEVPTTAFAFFWAALATRYKSQPQVIFGLMNEPFGLPTEQWRDAAQAAILSIRNTGAKNLILVPGVAWTGAHSWLATGYGTPNGVALLSINDPARKFAFEAHQYLDQDSSGTSPNCVAETVGVTRLEQFTQWLKQHHGRGFLGEFAGGANPLCLGALDGMLAYMRANPDVWLGWTYWAAGPWWGNYFFSVEPRAGAEAAQLSVLRKYAVR
jgi:endoglucanase